MALKRVLWENSWCVEHSKSLWTDILGVEKTESRSLSPRDFQMSPYSPSLEVELEDRSFKNGLEVAKVSPDTSQAPQQYPPHYSHT